jgi:hypothetical protein
MTGLYEFLIREPKKYWKSFRLQNSKKTEIMENLTQRSIMDLPSGGKVIRGKITNPKIIYRDEFSASDSDQQEQYVCGQIPNGTPSPPN